MKLKGLTKLALSGVALAAVAATLGTSTYAWYVTNSTATATGAHAAANAGGMGNVLVAQKATDTETSNGTAANGHGKFVQQLAFNDASFNRADINAENGFTPVTPRTITAVTNPTAANLGSYYEEVNTGSGASAKTKYVLTTDTEVSSTKTYYTNVPAAKIDADTVWINGEDNVDKTANGNYLQFDLWVSSTTSQVGLEYEFINETAANAYKAQIAYAGIGLPTGVAQGGTFVKNIQDALRMSYVQTDYTKTTTTSTTEIAGYAPVPAGAEYDSAKTYYTTTDVADLTKYTVAVIDAEEGFVEGTTYYTAIYKSSVSYTEKADNQATSYVNNKAKFIDLGNSAANISRIVENQPTGDLELATGGNAHTYFETVVGRQATYTTTTSVDSNAITLAVPTDGETKLSFYIWLEGADQDCFDSVAGQSFRINFNFKAITD